MGTKQGCPQDRESSGHVGIHVKKKCTHNFFVCKQTLLPGGVCAHMHICINKFSFCYVLQDLGEWEGWKNQRKGNYCLHSGGMFIPLAVHISTGQSPQRTLLLLVRMGREEMETVRVISHSAICQVSGTAEMFQWAKSPPPAQGFCPGEPQHFSSCRIKVRIWPWLNHPSISQRFIHVLYSKPLSSLCWPAQTSHGDMYKCLQNWVPWHTEHCTKSHSETTLLVFKKIENSLSLTQAFFFFLSSCKN